MRHCLQLFTLHSFGSCLELDNLSNNVTENYLQYVSRLQRYNSKGSLLCLDTDVRYQGHVQGQTWKLKVKLIRCSVIITDDSETHVRQFYLHVSSTRIYTESEQDFSSVNICTLINENIFW